ncbi:MAG: tripartite tricarboxylate transporter TctB family protein [Eubacteriaceae bacterium]|nr:tripartite tricarboxylate transporter TctB family protein [Eubacteriaceae bacterium]
MSAKDKEMKQAAQSVQNPGELYFLLILFSVFALFFYEASKQNGLLQGELGGPGVIPQLMIGASLIMIVLLFLQFRKNHYKESYINDVIKTLFSKDLVAILGTVVLYALLLESLKFILTSSLFLFFSMALLDRKKFGHKLMISLATVAMIVLIFRYIFQVVLP